MSSPHELQVTVEHEDGATVLLLAGDLDTATAAALRSVLAQATLDHDGPVIVDLAGVGFVDSAGLNALVHGYRVLVAYDRTLVARNLSSSVRRAFEITALDTVLCPPTAGV